MQAKEDFRRSLTQEFTEVSLLLHQHSFAKSVSIPLIEQSQKGSAK